MRPERTPIFYSLFSRRAWILAAILCLLIAVPVSASSADAPAQVPPPTIYDSQTFIQKLGELKAGLETARASTESLRAYRESLPTSWAVSTGKRHFVVPTGLLVSQLVKAEIQPEFRTLAVKQALDYLDALASEAASISAQQTTPTESARAKLNAILSRPEYARAMQQSWWDKVRSRINEMLFDAMTRIFGALGSQESLGYILLWIGVGAAAVFIAYWIFRRWIRTARGEEMALQAAAVPLRSWQEWVYAARESAARADYRMAIHCAYWAGIARLQDLGALSPDRSKTPREYLAALAKSKMVVPETLASRQQALHRLTSRLEKMWYGYQVATEADFRDSLIQLETLGCRLP
jgi:hypothetical protein